MSILKQFLTSGCLCSFGKNKFVFFCSESNVMSKTTFVCDTDPCMHNPQRWKGIKEAQVDRKMIIASQAPNKSAAAHQRPCESRCKLQKLPNSGLRAPQPLLSGFQFHSNFSPLVGVANLELFPKNRLYAFLKVQSKHLCCSSAIYLCT